MSKYTEWADGHEEGERLGYKDAPEYALEDAKACKSAAWVAGFEEGYEYGQQLLHEGEEDE